MCHVQSMALLEAPYVKDTNKSVGQHIKEQIAVIGENIQACPLHCDLAGLHSAQEFPACTA